VGDRLDEYREKRRAGATPEPFGGGEARPRAFVVQKHWASSLHYDFRLEWQGVLLSWAVPKGPSLDPGTKRLAVRTEDHPVEYADFEGTIPEGNYGAGHVIVWDQGTWVPLEDPEAGLEQGKLLFELRGFKLRGTWTIFRTKRDGEWTREWLLVKKPDAYADEDDACDEASVLSGLTVEELKEGTRCADRIRGELAKLRAPERTVEVGEVDPMHAQVREEPFSSPGWIYELKYDGFRLLCGKTPNDVRLSYRSGRDATPLYPEVVRSVRALPFDSLVLDAEVAVLDEQGRPEFQLLQKRAQLSREADVERAAVAYPVVCYVFDLLALDGYDLRELPLIERKRLLREVLPPAGTLQYADHVEERGEEFYEGATRLGVEGVVAKQADSRYVGGRSDRWLKFRADRRRDFVVCGFTAPKRGRAGLGALHLGAYDAGELVYAGRVGTGFKERELEDLRATLDGMLVDEPPCTGPVPRTRGNSWTRPELVVEVRYKERTADGLLRQPSFQRLREDKRPDECLAPEARGAERALEPELPAVEPTTAPGEFRGTNLDKVFWPDEGFTKGDLIEYYRAVGPALLPYLRDRPLVLTRYPDGITGKSFFQKDAPSWVPDWLRTERIWSEQTARDIDYFVADDVPTLLFLANLGTIPLHVWSSRVTDLARPDWCVIDLDPKGAPFEHVVKVARAVHRLCERIGLEGYVKTSGSTGLHVLLPLGGQCTYEQSRTLGELVSRVVEAELPDIATTARVVKKREGRVYLDYMQNGHGQLIVAPYSVRPVKGATVSAPLRWSEVNAKLSLRKFTIETMPARLERQKRDPLLEVLEGKPDLVAVLDRLAGLLR